MSSGFYTGGTFGFATPLGGIGGGLYVVQIILKLVPAAIAVFVVAVVDSKKNGRLVGCIAP